MSRHTPLFEEHGKLNAKLVDFAGWMMPVQYAGVREEHRAVRNAAGLFDVSHMGQIEFTGPDALSTVQRLTTNDASHLIDGQAQYSLLCNERGTIVDDIIVYRFSADHFLFVVNASNTGKDLSWCERHTSGNVIVQDRSDDFALIALQGPYAEDLINHVSSAPITELPRYHFQERALVGKPCTIARTGYTGEDGVEIFTAPADAPAVWQALLETGKPYGVQPIGLGARDTLRLEMKYSLYGHEITEETTPLEAGLAWVVKLDKDADFLGKQALTAQKQGGIARTLIGFRMCDPGIPRQGYRIRCDEGFGVVTSGTMSPSLNVAIGIGYVPLHAKKIDTTISVDIRGREREAIVVKTPFYASMPERRRMEQSDAHS